MGERDRWCDLCPLASMGWLAEAGLQLAGFTHANAGPLGWVVPPLSTFLAERVSTLPPRSLDAHRQAPCRGAAGPAPATTARTRWISRGLGPLIGVVFILLSPASPAAAAGAGAPIRWNTGGAVWSTSQDSFDTFLRTGEVTDRGLAVERDGRCTESSSYAIPLMLNYIANASLTGTEHYN